MSTSAPFRRSPVVTRLIAVGCLVVALMGLTGGASAQEAPTPAPGAGGALFGGLAGLERGEAAATVAPETPAADVAATPTPTPTETVLSDQVAAVTVVSVDFDGNPVPGACIAVNGRDIVDTYCTAADGRGQETVSFAVWAESDYAIAESTTPDGYGTAPATTIAVAPLEIGLITIVHAPAGSDEVSRMATPEPEPTATPTDVPTQTPEPTATTAPTAVPTPTETPAPTGTPVPTETPDPATPAPTERPVPPAPTETPEPTVTPEPTEAPVPTETPDPTATAVPTQTAEPTLAPEPTGTPVPTEAPVPTVTPVPTEAPQPTATAVPTEVPAPTDTPVPTEKPAPTGTAAPTIAPVPTATPEPPPTTAAIASPAASPVAPGEESLGTIQVETLGTAGDFVAGACYRISDAFGTDERAGAAIACGVAPDGTAAPVVFADLAPGPYVVTPAGAPAGYVAAVAKSVSVGAGETLTVTFTPPVAGSAAPAPETATILVLALDAATGNPALGSCYLLVSLDAGAERWAGCIVPGTGGQAAAPISFVVPAPGTYTVTALLLPQDTSARPASQETSVTPGQTFTLVIGVIPDEG